MLKELIEENDGYAEITRGDVAKQVNCVPSQVTYVLSTRFTSNQGYRVESRRGGGGSIKIYKIDIGNDITGYIMHVVNSMGNFLTQQQADIYIRNFLDYEIIDETLARVFRAATSDKSLEEVEPEIRSMVRMDILKNMLVELLMGQ